MTKRPVPFVIILWLYWIIISLMKADIHLHSEFSDDSIEPMEFQIDRAVELGFEEICFTEHVDYGQKRDWDDPELKPK